jgi:hypothetical protein
MAYLVVSIGGVALHGGQGEYGERGVSEIERRDGPRESR